ncbi:uncharacterized protein L201_002118 [Kwoniella dendrophila CBS 6074]|uniref:Protein YOP1 n=1 Tax=Kwoniella dendrophila CBS 6074 TaxID=1295534 RepID=A0AAX4JRV2_9TREE
MDPTTSAHTDPFGGPAIAADLTSRQPALNETSGLTTSEVPTSSGHGAGVPHGTHTAPQLGAPSGFNNPFLSGASAGAGAGTASTTGETKASYPEVNVYSGLNTNTRGDQEDFADIHARSTGSTGGPTLSGNSGLSGTGSSGLSFDKGYSESQLNQTAQSAQSTTNDLSDKTNETINQASNKTNELSNKANETAQQASNKTKETINQTSNKVNQLSSQASQKANETATGIRQRVKRLSVDLNNAADHPAIQNAKKTTNNYIQQFRDQLGRSQTVRDLEQRTGIDRVALVVGGVLGYILLIPLNILRLAQPITNLLTVLPATYLAAYTLDKPDTDANDQKVKSLLSFFVVLGAIQTLESLMAGFLERRVPQYFTVKLLFLAYLLHPRTQGALQVHERVFKPLLATAQRSAKSAPPPSSSYSSGGTGGLTGQSQSTYSAPRQSSTASTPPTSKPSLSTVNSPVQPQGYTTMAASIPLPSEHDQVTRADAQGQGFAVVSELH